MQNTGDGTQKGGRREDKEPHAKPKGRCGGLGVLGERGDPDPGKTFQIRWCRRTGGGGQDRGRKASQERRERLLHEEAFAGRGFGLAGRRLFLDLAETEFKHFGC